MPQWEYFSLKYTGDYLFQNFYTDTHTSTTPIYMDQGIDNSLTDTLHRYIAGSGLIGWELVNILSDEASQEWIFKRPIFEENN